MNFTQIAVDALLTESLQAYTQERVTERSCPLQGSAQFGYVKIPISLYVLRCGVIRTRPSASCHSGGRERKTGALIMSSLAPAALFARPALNSNGPFPTRMNRSSANMR